MQRQAQNVMGLVEKDARKEFGYRDDALSSEVNLLILVKYNGKSIT